MKSPSTFAERAFDFYRRLTPPGRLPGDVEVMNPYHDSEVMGYVKQFLRRYYSDNSRRIAVFGINPGRFGAGITGITFTDPVVLETVCGIKNDLPKKREPSSVFVYAFVERFGGAAKLFRHFFFTAVSPLGFTKDGRNYNFYDDPSLLSATRPFIVKSLRDQVSLGVSLDVAVVLGSGKNRSIFEGLNREFGFFKAVISLDHPRFIIQYRRAQLEEYLRKYEEAFHRALER